MDRAHRIGQKKEVRVFRFITEGTVEEKIIERADRKLFLDAAVIQQGRMTDQLSNNMNKNELMRMVKFGADAILTNKGGDFTDEDIETLLTRGKERTEAIKSKLQTEVQHTLANFSVQMEDTSKSMNLFEFAGENFGEGGEGGEGEGGRLSLGLELGTRERRRSHYDTVNYMEDVDLEGNPKEPSVRKLNKKNVFTLPDYQFFDRPRLDEIFTLEAELSAARSDQIRHIKKLRHDDEIEVRRVERVARGWNVNRNKKLGLADRGKDLRDAAVVEKTGDGAAIKEEEGDKMEVVNGNADEEKPELQQEQEQEQEQEEQTSSEDKEGSEATSTSSVAKSAMALEADRLEAELGSEPFPNIASLGGEIQFYHSRALLSKAPLGADKPDDIVSGKFNLSQEVQREKECLILAGFPRWSKSHQRGFVNGMER